MTAGVHDAVDLDRVVVVGGRGQAADAERGDAIVGRIGIEYPAGRDVDIIGHEQPDVTVDRGLDGHPGAGVGDGT